MTADPGHSQMTGSPASAHMPPGAVPSLRPEAALPLPPLQGLVSATVPWGGLWPG